MSVPTIFLQSFDSEWWARREMRLCPPCGLPYLEASNKSGSGRSFTDRLSRANVPLTVVIQVLPSRRVVVRPALAAIGIGAGRSRRTDAGLSIVEFDVARMHR